MTQYELVDGQEAYISDAATIGFMAAMEGLTTLITIEGRIVVKGYPRDLHAAWEERQNGTKIATSDLVSRYSTRR